MNKITIYTDGGARGNPGPAGAGAVIVDEHGSILKKASRYVGEKTNNWAEYEGVILGLETAKKLFGVKKLSEMKIEMKLDSELVTRQLSSEYQIKEENLFGQFIKAHNIAVQLPHISFTHIPREENCEADRLVNEAIDHAG